MRHNSNQSEIHPFPEGYPQEGLLEGRNALQEALRSGRTIDKVWVAAGDTDRNLARLTSEAKEQGAVVIPVDRRKLDSMSITHAHQGVIALAAARPYATLDDIFALAESRGEAPLVVVCDELSDPHNLGAIEYMPVARVSNISSALKELQARGVWVYGTAADGTQELFDANFQGPTAIVIGNEGAGMGRLVRQTCDVLVRIPMRGRISSLNASAAAAILLYEAVRQRK